MYDQQRGEFRFVPGPIFANVVLVDEINRATPRTQSALLEPMEERQVTVEGTTYALPSPYLVIATENPVEQHGTYPLPEGQLDRFALTVQVGYPDTVGAAPDIVRRQLLRHPAAGPAAGARRPSDVLAAQLATRRVHVDDSRARVRGGARAGDARRPRDGARRLAALHRSRSRDVRRRAPSSRGATTSCPTT